MNRDVLRQTLLYSEDVFAFATDDELKALQAHEPEYSALVDVMREVADATEPPSDAQLLRFFRACRSVDEHFPRFRRVPGPTTSVSAIVGLARDCIEEAVRAGSDTREGLAVREAGRLMRFEERTRGAWWLHLMDRVAPGDEQLAVIAPGPTHGPAEYRAIGQALEAWKQAHSFVRYIAGLDELLDGRYPRTPPLYLAVPYQDLPNAYESVALVFVAQGTNHKAASATLKAALAEWVDQLSCFCDPITYSNHNR